jgi:hypothetical protein
MDLHFPTLRQAQRAYRIEHGLSGHVGTADGE